MNLSIRKNLPVLVCSAASIGLFTELHLSKKGASLCHTNACEIVARYVRFGEPLLLAFGASFFLIIAGLLIFNNRYPTKTWLTHTTTIALAGATSFDGALIGFQYVTLGQKCIICLTVATLLVTVAGLYAIGKKTWLPFLIACAAWSAGFAANASLIMPDVTTAQSGMVFYQRPAAKDVQDPDTATLIVSLECPHCKEVLKHLAQSNPNKRKWRFAVVDSSKTSLDKLGYFFQHAADSNNPFELLLQSKERSAALPEKLAAKLPEVTRQAQVFLSTNNIKGVPLLVVSSSKKIVFYKGSSAIMDFLQRK